MGIMDKNLRNQGIKADAITIDCIALDKKIVILIHDDKPDVVSIALGNKDGDIHSSSQYLISEISETVIVDIMQVNFIL
jgi:AmiR/NasT family two-component response regulator